MKQARSHAKLHGPGTIPEIKTDHRVRLDMGKVDHFVEFINGPYFYQDVLHGNKVLALDNGDRIEMPNVVRILTRSTMIEQYLLTTVCTVNSITLLALTTVESLRLVILLIPSSDILVRISINRLASNAKG